MTQGILAIGVPTWYKCTAPPPLTHPGVPRQARLTSAANDPTYDGRSPTLKGIEVRQAEDWQGPLSPSTSEL